MDDDEIMERLAENILALAAEEYQNASRRSTRIVVIVD
jgi:hypothetical protein